MDPWGRPVAPGTATARSAPQGMASKLTRPWRARARRVWPAAAQAKFAASSLPAPILSAATAVHALLTHANSVARRGRPAAHHLRLVNLGLLTPCVGRGSPALAPSRGLPGIA